MFVDGSMTGVPVMPMFCPMSLQDGRSETLKGPSPSRDRSLELIRVPGQFSAQRRSPLDGSESKTGKGSLPNLPAHHVPF